jgi:sec-independent protein translocase protein TatA
MFGIGTTELIVVLVIVLIIFGVGRLPDIGSGLGKAIKNFKKATSDSEIDVTPVEDKPKLDTASGGRRKEKAKKHTVA